MLQKMLFVPLESCSTHVSSLASWIRNPPTQLNPYSTSDSDPKTIVVDAPDPVADPDSYQWHLSVYDVDEKDKLVRIPALL
jgi:hypothetical protein